MDNSAAIIAVEILSAGQAIDLRLDGQDWDPEGMLGANLAQVYNFVREQVPFIRQDSRLSGYIKQMAALIINGDLEQLLKQQSADLKI